MRQSKYRIPLAFAAAASSLTTASAFTSGSLPLALAHRNVSPLFAEESSSSSSVPAAAKPIDEGSHDELMYALGVNLARQLGDIRPLVETSEELTQVARGLLDTVVGKFDDESQRSLLARRGDDLNKVIVERA